MSDASLPPELINRLATEALEDIITVDAFTASPSQMRAYASQRLNIMTPKALTNLNHLLSCPDEQTQFRAISKVLDLAPGTKPLDPRLEPALSDLPESALNALIAGLSAFGRGLGLGLAASTQPASTHHPDLIVTATKETTDAL